MKKRKFIHLLYFLMLCGCYNTPLETSSSSSFSQSDNFLDIKETKPLYDGKPLEVSKVVTDEKGTYLEYDGKPFVYLGTQIRTDAFMNCDGFTYEQLVPLFSEAEKLGVTCVQIPLEWAKIELAQDKFDFTFLHRILAMAVHTNIKVEFLWYGTNMCGDTHSYTVPDYILKDGKTYPKFDAKRTGEFWNYYGIQWFLDFDNENLISREASAIQKAMDAIYEWDSTHGGTKPVVGMQILNEPDIFVRWRIPQKSVISPITNMIMSSEEGYEKIYNSLNALGKAVKNSKYRVYTRVNLASSTSGDYYGNSNGIYTNNSVKDAPSWAKRMFYLDGIDVIGDDSYTSSVKNIKGISRMYANLEGNFSHIAENDGNYDNTPSLILTSASQKGGYSIYDLVTSPFFVANNSANIDQGIITFSDKTYKNFNYKKHYEETQRVLKGLKMISSEWNDFAADDFLAFNVKTDNPQKSLRQTISSHYSKVTFSCDNYALAFAIDFGDHLDIYSTQDATFTFEGISGISLSQGSFIDGKYTIEDNLEGTTLSAEQGKLYRVNYTSGSQFTSTAFGEIGGGL